MLEIEKYPRQKNCKLLVEVWRIQLSALSPELGRDARYGQLPQYSRLSNSDPTLFSLLSAREDILIASRLETESKMLYGQLNVNVIQSILLFHSAKPG